MKKFEAPTLEVDRLEEVDVITTSTVTEDNVNPCPNNMGEW